MKYSILTLLLFPVIVFFYFGFIIFSIYSIILAILIYYNFNIDDAKDITNILHINIFSAVIILTFFINTIVNEEYRVHPNEFYDESLTISSTSGKLYKLNESTYWKLKAKGCNLYFKDISEVFVGNQRVILNHNNIECKDV